MRVPFFRVAERKEPKKGRPHCLRPLRFAPGQPAVLGFGGVSLELAALRQSRALIRQTLRSSAHPEGHGGQNIHTGHRCARPHLAGASASRCANWAERSDGPNGCPAVRLFGCSAAPPLLAAPAAGRLRGGTRVAARVLRELTRRSCLNGARQRAVSSAAHPATGTPQVCPFALRRGRRLGVAFSLVTFFWRSKRKLLACRATPGLRPQQRHAAKSAHATKHY